MTFFAKLDARKKCFDVFQAQLVSPEDQELRQVDLFFERQANAEPGAVRT